MSDTSNFAERLVARSAKTRPDTSVSPAMTPDVIPPPLVRPDRGPSSFRFLLPALGKGPAKESSAAPQAVGPPYGAPSEGIAAPEARMVQEAREKPQTSQIAAPEDNLTGAESSSPRPTTRPFDGVRLKSEPGAADEYPDKKAEQHRERAQEAKPRPSGGAGEEGDFEGDVRREPAEMELHAPVLGERRAVPPKINGDRDLVPTQGRADRGKKDGAGVETQPLPEPRRQKTSGFEQRTARSFMGDSEPTVSIHIGRIEVKAILPSTPPVKAEAGPVLSLAEYLRKRREGSG